VGLGCQTSAEVPAIDQNSFSSRALRTPPAATAPAASMSGGEAVPLP
jgi:hypothetical protein